MRVIIGATSCQVCGVRGGELGLCKVCEARVVGRMVRAEARRTRHLTTQAFTVLALAGLVMVAVAYLVG